MGALGFGFPLRRTFRRSFDPARLFAGGTGGGWYDPSDRATLFQDANGTVAATVGAPVGRIADKSRRGNHLVQAVAAARPILRVDANGRSYLEFDGIDDRLATPTAAPVLAQPITVVLAASFGASAGNYERVFDAAPGHGSRVLFGEHDTVTLAFAGELSVSEPMSFPVPTDVWGLVYSGAASVMRRRGAVRSSGNAGSGTLGGVMMGAGNHQGGSEFMAGRVYGLLIAGRVLDAVELPGAERWMAARAGVRF